MNVLFLVPRRIYEEKMSRVRFEEMEALSKTDPRIEVVTTGPGWPDWPDGLAPRDYVQQRYDFFKANHNLREIPHVVVSYMVEGLQGAPIPVAMILHETYNRVKTLRAIEDTGANLVIFTYNTDITQYAEAMEAQGRRLVWIPHGADGDLYRDYGLEKDVDVLVVGNLARDFYPFRARLARLAHREIRKRGYKVVTLPHPGFTLPARPGTAVGEAYARWLNRAKLVMTCTGKHHYAFCKLVEIPLCRSLPVSDLPTDRQGFFRQTTLNVEMWHTDREILGKIEDVLDDDGLRERLTAVAHDKVRQRLTLAHWSERFIYWARVHVWGESPELPMAPVGDEDG